MVQVMFQVNRVVKLRRIEGKHVIEVEKPAKSYSEIEKVAIRNRTITLLNKVID
jgi:hypothetical protein